MIPTMTTAASVTLLGLACLSYLVRRVLPQSHWFHEPKGAGVLALVSGIIPSVVQAVQVGGVHASIVVPAMTGAIMSLLASSNPSAGAPPSDDVVKTPPSTPGSKGFIDPHVLLVLGFVGFVLVTVLSSCAPGADGLRQACTNADNVITAGYQGVVTWDKAEWSIIRTEAHTNVEKAKADGEAHDTAVAKALAVLDKAVSDKHKFCDQAWTDAPFDWGSLLSGALQVAIDVRQAMAAILPGHTRAPRRFERVSRC